MTLDLSMLKRTPALNNEAILQIEPLTPLSMVSELPGSYYKTLKSPSKKMLCGLFENILEWHIDIGDRKKILNEVKKLRKKQELTFPETAGSDYEPLLREYFNIVLPLIPPVSSHYDDLWTRAFRRNDSFRHTNNSRFMEASFLEDWRRIKRKVQTNEKRSSTQKNALLDKFFKRYQENFPMYYGSPTSREYVSLDGNYEIKILIDSVLLDLLKAKLIENNIGYLGSSEGWVNIELINI